MGDPSAADVPLPDRGRHGRGANAREFVVGDDPQLPIVAQTVGDDPVFRQESTRDTPDEDRVPFRLASGGWRRQRDSVSDWLSPSKRGEGHGRGRD